MCNDYEQHIRFAEFQSAMQALHMPLEERIGATDLPQADDIRIGNDGPILTLNDDKALITSATFGFPPKGRGGPVFNFRSEGRHFGESRRCVVPASAFFEFKGQKSPKAKYRFALRDAPFLGIAGLWRESDGNRPPSFTMLTTQPGPDIAPYHDRQVVVLRPENWESWLRLSRAEAELLKPLPEGSLSVEQVRAGSD
jgi:putative SOS response-associated peptidase YedK